MLTEKRLKKHEPFLNALQKSKTSQDRALILKGANLSQLKTLATLVKAIALDKDPYSRSKSFAKDKKKLVPLKSDIKTFIDEFSSLSKIKR